MPLRAAELVSSASFAPRAVDGAIARIEHTTRARRGGHALYDAARRAADDAPPGPFRGVRS